MKDGKCIKESNFFDSILDNVHIGVGVGGRSGDGGGPKIDTPP